MPALQLGSLWPILRQVNIGSIHAEAERAIDIVVAGPPGSPAEELAEILRSAEAITDRQPASVVRTAGPPLDAQTLASAPLLIAVDMDPQALATFQHHVPVIPVNTSTTQPSSHPAIQPPSHPA
ncbi:MAG: hypothetical protein ACE5HA_08865, partial [Anaerolineae bacterium]